MENKVDSNPTEALRLSSLCHPDGEKSCFFCCPPLRPPGFDPLDHRDKLEKAFWRKRMNYLHRPLKARPIDGRSCWALGYLDDEKRQTGCLLHPYQHAGQDFRELVDYGDKCAREICLEAMTFSQLSPEERNFFLHLSKGMDSFEYSSRKYNPLFPMLMWGHKTLRAIAQLERYIPMRKDKFCRKYAAFLYQLSFQLDGYLVEELIPHLGVGYFLNETTLGRYIFFREGLISHHLNTEPTRRGKPKPPAPLRIVHSLGIPISLSRLLKFGLHLWYSTQEELDKLLSEIQEQLNGLFEREGKDNSS